MPSIALFFAASGSKIFSKSSSWEILKLPLWLMTVDDYALLLGADSHVQLPIIERMLKLVNIFSESDEMANRYKICSSRMCSN